MLTAHFIQGQFALLRCIEECGPDVLDLTEKDGSVKISLNASQIRSHAVPALAKFLLGLQVYRSTADVQSCTSLLNKYSDVDERFARYRSIVTQQKPTRIQYVQANTVLENGQVSIRNYLPTRESLIQSWAERCV